MDQLASLEGRAKGLVAHLVAGNVKVAHATTCFVAVRAEDRAAVHHVVVVHLLD